MRVRGEIAMKQQHAYQPETGYLRIKTFNLNSKEHTSLGVPVEMPADSFLFSYFQAKRTFHILMDAGKKNQCQQIIIPYLLESGITRIDMAILTHPHQDHFGGFIDILEHPDIAVDQIIYAPVSETDVEKGGVADQNYDNWQQFDAVLQRNKHLHRAISRENIGEQIRIDADLYWDIIDVPLFQQDEMESSVNLNNLNLVLKLSFKEFTALFPGDCAAQQTEGILQSAASKQLSKLFLLKAAHHGGDQSINRELIEACDARVVIIPSNYYIVENKAAFAANNHLYSKNGAKVFRTDVFETIELTTDGYSVTCSAEAQDYSETVYFSSCSRN